MPDEYFDCILRWQETRNGLTGLKRADIGYENGVLTLELPKAPEIKPEVKKIEIQ